jgi:hypothetical protein
VGIYAFANDNGTHLVIGKNNSRWLIHPNDVKLASKDEIEKAKDELKTIDMNAVSVVKKIQGLLPTKSNASKQPSAISIPTEEEILLSIVCN